MLRWGLFGVLSWLPLIAALRLLHAFTFGRAILGRCTFIEGRATFGSGERAIPLCCGIIGPWRGLRDIGGVRVYASYSGRAYLFMAALSTVGLLGALGLRRTVVGRPEPQATAKRSA
jgi:hypothetical protein